MSSIPICSLKLLRLDLKESKGTLELEKGLILRLILGKVNRKSDMELGSVIGLDLFELKYCIIMDHQLQLELEILRNHLGKKF